MKQYEDIAKKLRNIDINTSVYYNKDKLKY